MTVIPFRGLSRAAAPMAVVATAGIIAACGGSPQTPQAQALAYMNSHPAPVFSPGMTAGIVLTDEDKGFAGAAAVQADCPTSLTAYTARSVGSPPGCGAWTITVETAGGRTAVVSCGSIPARQACPMLLDGNPDTYMPFPGDYILFNADGHVDTAADIRLLTFEAVDIPGPDDNAPFVTTSGSPR
jgi:hypothetical protein